MEQRQIRYTHGADLQSSYQGLTLSKSALGSEGIHELKARAKFDDVEHEDKYLVTWHDELRSIWDRFIRAHNFSKM